MLCCSRLCQEIAEGGEGRASLHLVRYIIAVGVNCVSYLCSVTSSGCSACGEQMFCLWGTNVLPVGNKCSACGEQMFCLWGTNVLPVGNKCIGLFHFSLVSTSLMAADKDM